MTTFKIFYANGQGVQDLVRILRRDIDVSNSYESNSIYTVSTCGKSVSKVQELPREAETVLVLAGLGDPIDPVILPEWFNVFRKRNNTVIALLDPSAAFKEKFLSYLLPSDTLYYLEGFRNLRWGMKDPNLPEGLNTCLDICNWNIKRTLQSRPTKFIFKTRGVFMSPSRLYVISSIMSSFDRMKRFEVTSNVGDKEGEERPYCTKEQYETAYRSVCDYVGSKDIESIKWPGIYRGFWNQEQNGGGFIHEDMMVSERPYFWLEVVAETDKIQTEKVFKPMLWAIPCLYLGHSGTIANLHRQGFWTFDKYWDESYDELPYSYERVDRIFQIVDSLLALPIQELVKMYEDMVPIFRHNAEVLDTEPDYIEEIYKTLNSIYNTV